MNMRVFNHGRRQRVEIFRELNTLLTKCNEILEKNSSWENWKILGKLVWRATQYAVMAVVLAILGFMLLMGLAL